MLIVFFTVQYFHLVSDVNASVVDHFVDDLVDGGRVAPWSSIDTSLLSLSLNHLVKVLVDVKQGEVRVVRGCVTRCLT